MATEEQLRQYLLFISELEHLWLLTAEIAEKRRETKLNHWNLRVSPRTQRFIICSLNMYRMNRINRLSEAVTCRQTRRVAH